MARKIAARLQFNARVTARTLYANELRKPEHAERVARAGLLEDDLAEIEERGKDAERFDREQQSELASERVRVNGSASRWRSLVAERDALRARVPAVVLDLAAAPATKSLAGFLDKISFEGFRFRSVAPEPVEGQPAQAPVRQRVAREDRQSVALQVANFARSLLDEERSPIVAALEARGFGRERLAQLQVAAAAQAAMATSSEHLMRGPEATKQEAEAVAAQNKRWNACRRMLHAAAKGHPALERFWESC